MQVATPIWMHILQPGPVFLCLRERGAVNTQSDRLLVLLGTSFIDRDGDSGMKPVEAMKQDRTWSHLSTSALFASPGAIYYFNVKYDTRSLAGISVKQPYRGVKYILETMLNEVLIPTSPESIPVKPKK